MNDSEFCCVHSTDSEEYEIPGKKEWCMVYAMYFMFFLHMCLFAYTINTPVVP